MTDAGNNGGNGGAADQKDTWTIMLYLSGDNNLSPEMVRALTDIKLQALPEGVNFTVQYDPQSPGFNTFRYALKSGETENEKAERMQAAIRNEAYGPLPIPGYLVKSLANEDSADPFVLARFIRWSVNAFPKSKHRMLILSGHGSGAVGDFLTDSNARSGRPNSLSIPELAKALRLAQTGYENDEATQDKGAHEDALLQGALDLGSPDAKLIQILGMDSCLMGMAEVAYEVRARAEHLVGSEGFLPNTGWPYSQLLSQLEKRKGEGMDPPRVAKRLVKDTIDYYKQYIPAGTSLDMASCDLRKLDDLTEAVKALTKALNLPDQPDRLMDESRIVLDLVIAAHWRAQSYKFEQYTDLWDFCCQLDTATTRIERELPQAETQKRMKGIHHACVGVRRAIKELVSASDHSGPEFQHSHGLAVLFPWSTSTLGGNDALFKYGKLQFAKESEWSKFLGAYLTCSQREARREDGDLLEGTERPAQVPAPLLASGRHAEGASKHADGASKFADLISRLYAPGGTTLPWSMKNPPQGVRWRLYGSALQEGLGGAPPSPPTGQRPGPSTCDDETFGVPYEVSSGESDLRA
jgi:cysteine peptidase C11 family protein